MEHKKLVIGITGTLLAGKGTVVEILQSKGFQHSSIRELIREELAKNNIPLTRKSMQDMGNDRRKEFGQGYWMQKALDKFKSYTAPLIIESFRNMGEVDYLRSIPNIDFVLLGVDAPFEKRWERVKKRNVDSDLVDHDRFVIDDARDRGFNEPLTGQQVAMCLVHADFLINNDEEMKGKLEDSKLYKEVMDIYKKITKK
jgi:dephospho-CoA kinase